MAIPNPHWPGAPARMADGRQFTEYRSVCKLLPPMPDGPWGSFEQRAAVIAGGDTQRWSDRSLTAMRGGQTRCVDTMVPESAKRIYSWDGPVVVSGPWQQGIGMGRQYLPGAPQLAGGDPDRLAAATFPDMPGTFDANAQQYSSLKINPVSIANYKSKKYNRYSQPYSP